MYLYLYDSFLNEKKYASLLARIETRLTDLGISGKISRLSPLRNIEELINDEVRNGVKTIIVVGDDKTLNEVINIVAKHDIIMGLIPVGPHNRIAESLGIPMGEQGCTIISGRIIKRLDLGKINNSYFLSSLQVTGEDITIECEQQYKIKPPKQPAEVAVCNFRPSFATGEIEKKYFSPQDGVLELYIQSTTNAGGFGFFKRPTVQQSIIPVQRLTISGKPSVSVITENQKVIKAPIKIEVVPKKLRLIVGKKRIF